ncbi:NAD(P)H-binding protein [Paraneptunicella aestuarii]|uniref:NAD-dependent epimerase/dehydratase family protein n=1 Tax=Paraneptunicella aestuarii TaxID=2831148 RepID=UPI001E5FB9B6|nr:NAD-dependent epimerase/dehydratase family protein [Paraneptunicella aestuarii]UAA38695.1 NAD(P)H-binding protein [Paraneptunicella aestuarii]
MINSVTIIGAGWLGQALAEHLRDSGMSICLSARSNEKVQTLSQQGWQASQFELGNSVQSSLVNKVQNEHHLAIINIAPGRRNLEPETFVANMIKLIDELVILGTTHLLFISTTSVYGDLQGTITETTSTAPGTPSGKAHVEIENYIRQRLAKATILRLAGLVGGERHPAKSLSGKLDIPHPNQVVNLVHRNDVIKAISAIIDNDIWGQTLHLCSTEHPTRKEYYQWAAARFNLPKPEFLPEGSDSISGKLIEAKNTIKKLGITLDYPSPYDMI